MDRIRNPVSPLPVTDLLGEPEVDWGRAQQGQTTNEQKSARRSNHSMEITAMHDCIHRAATQALLVLTLMSSALRTIRALREVRDERENREKCACVQYQSSCLCPHVDDVTAKIDGVVAADRADCKEEHVANSKQVSQRVSTTNCSPKLSGSTTDPATSQDRSRRAASCRSGLSPSPATPWR
jgi:hypothetical protein